MLHVARSLGSTVLLAFLMLARGECALTSAYWTSAEIWDNPQTLDANDINSLVSLAVLYSDPAREATGWLVGALPRVGQALVLAEEERVASPIPHTGPTRAPPTA